MQIFESVFTVFHNTPYEAERLVVILSASFYIFIFFFTKVYMREIRQFGKRSKSDRLPEKIKLKDVFGICNDGYLSNKAKNFIKQTTSVDVDFKDEGDIEDES